MPIYIQVIILAEILIFGTFLFHELWVLKIVPRYFLVWHKASYDTTFDTHLQIVDIIKKYTVYFADYKETDMNCSVVSFAVPKWEAKYICNDLKSIENVEVL